MSLFHFEEDTGPAPRRYGWFAERALLNLTVQSMSCTLFEAGKRKAASATAADLQVDERHGRDCEDVESIAVPPTSDNQLIHTSPTGKWNPCFPARRILSRALRAG
jgi:hypothetical protein